MPFVKGHSGNPGGRPKAVLPDGRSVQELAREHTETAINALVSVLISDDTPPAAIVSAASAILDRGWGRPKQEVEAGENLMFVLADIIAERRSKVSEMNSGNEA
jgi:hypothetical protein